MMRKIYLLRDLSPWTKYKHIDVNPHETGSTTVYFKQSMLATNFNEIRPFAIECATAGQMKGVLIR